MKLLSLEQELSSNAYPGRGIVLGLTPDGTHAVAAYFIMGRSVNSRNRVFVEDGESIRSKPYHLRTRPRTWQQNHRYQWRPDRHHL